MDEGVQTVRQSPGAENVARNVATRAPRPRDQKGRGAERGVEAGLEAWSRTPRAQRPEAGRGIRKGGIWGGVWGGKSQCER